MRQFSLGSEVFSFFRINKRLLLPNVGTIIVVLALLLTQSVWVRSAASTESTSSSISTISYQGRLADSSQQPLNGTFTMEFRIYNVPSGGVPLWEEFRTGPNSVQVSDGLFNVMLGSLNTGLASAIAGQNELYLGITVGTDSEMSPRVQLGSVPYSFRAEEATTVSDASITTAKLADNAVTGIKISDGSVDTPDLASGSVVSDTLASGSVTQAKFAPGLDLVPAGVIVMWSGTLGNIPSGWALCDGTNGTPDLQNRFVVGAGNAYGVAATGGFESVTLSVAQLPSHSHSASVSNYGGFEHTFSKTDPVNGSPQYGRWTSVRKDPVVWLGGHAHTVSIGNTGSSQAHENRPPYYALAYIMKLP